jgi:hypothetical protein
MPDSSLTRDSILVNIGEMSSGLMGPSGKIVKSRSSEKRYVSR